MTRTFDIKHIQVILVDDPIQMRINKILAGDRAPVSNRMHFQIIFFDRSTQQGIVFQINLTNRQVIGCTPPRIHFGKIVFCFKLIRHVAPPSWYLFFISKSLCVGEIKVNFADFGAHCKQ